MLSPITERNYDNKTKLWIYFSKCYDSDGAAMQKVECVFCSKRYTYRNADSHGSLWRHLRTYHSLDLQNETTYHSVDLQNEAVESQSQINLSEQQHIVTEINIGIRRYFTLCDNGSVKCRVCLSARLIPNHEINLISHIKTHPRAYKLYELEKNFGVSGPEYVDPEKERISNLFTRRPNGTYMCKTCKRILACREDKLPKHLEDYHVGILKDDEEEIYTEIVNIGKAKKKSIAENKPQFTRPAENFKPKYKLTGADDLDNFGLYITSLLKDMPKDDCIKTQMAIVNQIIKAKLNVDNVNTVNEECNTTYEHNEEVLSIVSEDDVATKELIAMQEAEDVMVAEEDRLSVVNQKPSKMRSTKKTLNKNTTHLREESKRYKYAITKDINMAIVNQTIEAKLNVENVNTLNEECNTTNEQGEEVLNTVSEDERATQELIVMQEGEDGMVAVEHSLSVVKQKPSKRTLLSTKKTLCKNTTNLREDSKHYKYAITEDINILELS